MSKMATTSSGPRKAVMRSRTGKKKKIEFDTEDIFENENSVKRMSTTPTDSSHLVDKMSFPVSKKRGIDSLLQLLPLDPRRGLHRLVAWLSGTSKRIEWDPHTMELSVDGTIKKNSNLADILTYLWKNKDDESIYPSAHISGIISGVP